VAAAQLLSKSRLRANLVRNVVRVAITMIGLVLGSALCFAADPVQQRSVLVLDQSSIGLPFNTALATTLRLTLNGQSAEPISFYMENLDANRFSGREYEDDILSFFRRKYRDRHIDAIVVVGSAALDFILRRGAEIWPGVPVTFAAIDETTVAQLTLPPNVTGVTMQLTLQDMVKAARIAVPNLKQIAIVGDPLERQTFYRHFIDEIPIVATQVHIIDLQNLPLTELKDPLGKLPDDTAVLYTGIYFDPHGVAYIPAELVTQLSAWANRPFVINVGSALGKGAVGGYIVRPEQLGQETARIVLRILNGESLSDIAIAKVPSPLIFEWPALQRFGISDSTLPPGSEVRFRPSTMWEQYSSEMVVIFAALLVQAALICWLIFEHRRRHRAEVSSRNSMAELAYMNRRAAAGELSASIAHEVNQPLSGITTRASAALRWLAAEPPTPNIDKARTSLTQIVEAGHRAGDVIASIRAMFRKEANERSAIDINNLILTMLAIVRVDLERNGVELQTQLDDRLPIVEGDKTQLQQVTLNLVMNAIEAMQSVHYRALKVKSEQSKPGLVHISIEDTGTGIDPSNLKQIFSPLFTTKERGMGMGLSICHSIIENHGGSDLGVTRRQQRLDFPI
jgi:signal transduction histidine kinase